MPLSVFKRLYSGLIRYDYHSGGPLCWRNAGRACRTKNTEDEFLSIILYAYALRVAPSLSVRPPSGSDIFILFTYWCASVVELAIFSSGWITPALLRQSPQNDTVLVEVFRFGGAKVGTTAWPFTFVTTWCANYKRDSVLLFVRSDVVSRDIPTTIGLL